MFVIVKKQNKERHSYLIQELKSTHVMKLSIAHMAHYTIHKCQSNVNKFYKYVHLPMYAFLNKISFSLYVRCHGFGHFSPFCLVLVTAHSEKHRH